MKTFIEKFHHETGQAFSYLKLKDIVVSLRRKDIELVFIYPDYMDSIQDADIIEAAVRKLLNSPATIKIKFLKSHLDADFFKKDFMEFLKKFPAVGAMVAPDDIQVNAKDKQIRVAVEPILFKYCQERKLVEDVQKFLQRHYCDTIDFAFVASKAEEVIVDEPPKRQSFDLESGEGRYIVPQNIDALIGKHIYSRAMYIEDATKPNADVTVCGIVQDIACIEYKHKTSGELKKFYKLTLEDFTGEIEAVFFPPKINAEKITLLKTGKQIAIRGKIEKSERAPSGLSFTIKDISYCTLPENFVVNRRIRQVDTHYRTIVPQPYTEVAQASLFEAVHANPLQGLLGKTFVVFDLETTGLSPVQEKIVEMGAVKIVDGRITETFSSLIDPGGLIPYKATEIHGITDEMVAGCPPIEAVMPDFYKFVEDTIIVAHNLPFDLSFIAAKGKPLNIYFDHEKLDTLQVARKVLTKLTRHNLPYLSEYFNIVHESKHRAVDDAVATAKLLLKLSELQPDILQYLYT